VSNGLEITLKTFAATENEAAVPVLVDSLWARQFSVRDGSIKAILNRKGNSGKKELLGHWQDFETCWKDLIAEKHGKMSGALREVISGGDATLVENACDATIYLRDYDQIPTLIAAIEANPSNNSLLLEETLVDLCGELYKELGSRRQYGGGRKDPQIARRNSLSFLEDAVSRFSKHNCSAILEGYLMLVSRENATLKSILQSPKSQTFGAVTDLLKSSDQPGILRLLLSFLDDSQLPLAAVQLVAKRYDATYLPLLMNKIGFQPDGALVAILRKIDAIGWMSQQPELLDSLTDAQQQAAMQFAACSSMNRGEVFQVIKYLLDYGKTGGKRAAALALAQFEGPEANNLAMRLLDDAAPEIQAVIVSQLRDRNIPGAMNRLIELVDSNHPEIQDAAQLALEEFSFDRYLTAYDMLDDDVRRTTGELVRKADKEAKRRLKGELQEESRSRCLRALSMAPMMGLVDALETEILALAANTDHFIRTGAVKALGSGTTDTSLELIRDATSDNSVSVRAAAAESLELRGEPVDRIATDSSNADERQSEELVEEVK
jgi:hypothetical protein